MKLNNDNYYSKEANKLFMSVSQFKNGVECEARVIAELKDEYSRPYSKALTVGSYIHAHFESPEVFQEFYNDNHHIIENKKGEKYADFKQADLMIETLSNDSLAMYALQGEKEVIYTGTLFGHEWKIKIDNINHEKGFFSDIKTTKGLYDRYWSNRFKRYVSFVEMYGYDIQAAVYQEIIRQNTGKFYVPYIIAVTKEAVPDKAIIGFTEDELNDALDYVSENLHDITKAIDIMQTKKSCGRCEYCRMNKKLSNIMSLEDLLK